MSQTKVEDMSGGKRLGFKIKNKQKKKCIFIWNESRGSRGTSVFICNKLNGGENFEMSEFNVSAKKILRRRCWHRLSWHQIDFTPGWTYSPFSMVWAHYTDTGSLSTQLNLAVLSVFQEQKLDSITQILQRDIHERRQTGLTLSFACL